MRSLLQEGSNGTPFPEFTRDADEARAVHEVERARDVRMLQAGELLNAAAQVEQGRFVRVERIGKRAKGDGLLRFQVDSLPDDAHGTVGDAGFESVTLQQRLPLDQGPETDADLEAVVVNGIHSTGSYTTRR